MIEKKVQCTHTLTKVNMGTLEKKKSFTEIKKSVDAKSFGIQMMG